MTNGEGSERQLRAQAFARRLAAAAMRLSDFQRRSGLTRNVTYNLSKGQKPSSPEQAEAMERAFSDALPG